MTKADIDGLIEEVETAIDCIEQLDDHSPISAESLRSILQLLLKAEPDD